jgi:glutathione S-transferase
MAFLRLYDYPASGNCLKVRILLAQLGLPHERVTLDIFGGDTLTASYGEKNPARTTPLLEVDGDHLPESNAILWYLAEGTAMLPDGPFERGEVVRWLLFEQAWISGIARLRFRLQAGFLPPDDPSVVRWRESARRGLAVLEEHLARHAFLAGDAYSIADVANYAYVHVAPEAGIPLSDFPAVTRWLRRVEETPGFVNDLAHLPPDGAQRRGLSIYTV